MTRSIDLYELQETDTAIDAAERRLGEITHELESEGDMGALDQRIAESQAMFDEVQREHQEANDAVVDVKEKLAALEEKLYGGEVKLPRELKALQEDVQAHQRQLSSLEERALSTMSRLESAQTEVATGREEREARLAERERLMASLRSEQQDINAALEQLRSRRERQQERVDRPEQILYDRLRRARAGRAVSKVERGTCQGCRITLPNRFSTRQVSLRSCSARAVSGSSTSSRRSPLQPVKPRRHSDDGCAVAPLTGRSAIQRPPGA